MKKALRAALALPLLAFGCNIQLGQQSQSDGSSSNVVSASQFHPNETFVWSYYRAPSPNPIQTERLVVSGITGSTVGFVQQMQEPGQNGWTQAALFTADVGACVSIRGDAQGVFQLGWWVPNPGGGSWMYAGLRSDTSIFEDHFNCRSSAPGGSSMQTGRVTTAFGSFNSFNFAAPEGGDESPQNWFISDPGAYQGVSAERLIPFLGTPETVRLEAVTN